MIRAHVPASLERRVRLRAGHRCEYCRLSQARQEATFHVDHVTPLREGGATTLENLALACVSCSLRKGARTSAPDPASGKEAPIFNPRTQVFSHLRSAQEHRHRRQDSDGPRDRGPSTREPRRRDRASPGGKSARTLPVARAGRRPPPDRHPPTTPAASPDNTASSPSCLRRCAAAVSRATSGRSGSPRCSPSRRGTAGRCPSPSSSARRRRSSPC